MIWFTELNAQQSCRDQILALELKQTKVEQLQENIQECIALSNGFAIEAEPDCNRRLSGLLANYLAVAGSVDSARLYYNRELQWAGKCQVDTALIGSLINYVRFINNIRPDSSAYYLDIAYAELVKSDQKKGGRFSDFFASAFQSKQIDTLQLQPDLLAAMPHSYMRLWRQYFEIKGASLIFSTRTDEAELYYILALFLDHKNPMDDNESTSFSNLGLIYQYAGRHTVAVDYFLRSIEKNKADGMEFASINTLINICYSFRVIRRFDIAKSYAEHALKLTWELNLPKDRCRVLSQLSSVYIDERNYAKAEELLRESIRLSRSINNQVDLCYSLRKLADLQVNHLDQLEAGKLHADSSLYYARKIGDNAFEYYIESTYAGYFSKKGKYQQAKEFADHALRQSELYKDTEIQLASLYQLYEISEGMGDKAQALYHLKKWSSLKDSVSGRDMQFAISDLEKRYEGQKKQLRINELESEKARRKMVINLMIAGLISFALLAFAFIYFNRKLKRQQLKLQATNQKLTDLTIVQNKMFSIIGHDLKGLLVPYSKVGTIMKSYVSNGDMASMSKFAEKLEEASGRLSLTLNNLLHWALSQINGFTLKEEMVVVHAAVEHIAYQYADVLKLKNIVFRVDVRKTDEIKVDKEAFGVVLRNLISNAIKYTEQGTVDVIGRDTSYGYTLEIKDSGMGMSQDQITQLMFYKLTDSKKGTRGEQGSGIGLNIVRGMLELMKGSMLIISEIGKGTSVILTFNQGNVTKDIPSGR